MPNAAFKAAAYSLNHTPELALWYGNTPFVERDAPRFGIPQRTPQV